MTWYNRLFRFLLVAILATLSLWQGWVASREWTHYFSLDKEDLAIITRWQVGQVDDEHFVPVGTLHFTYLDKTWTNALPYEQAVERNPLAVEKHFSQLPTTLPIYFSSQDPSIASLAHTKPLGTTIKCLILLVLTGYFFFLIRPQH